MEEVNTLSHTLCEIDFFTNIVEQERATGRSTRIVDGIIQDFFNKPMGTIIPIYDHFSGVNFNWHHPERSDWCHYNRRTAKWDVMREADHRILKVVEGRLKCEHGGIKYKVITGNPRMQEERHEDVVYSYAIVRETPTFKEKLEQLLKEAKNGKVQDTVGI